MANSTRRCSRLRTRTWRCSRSRRRRRRRRWAWRTCRALTLSASRRGDETPSSGPRAHFAASFANASSSAIAACARSTSDPKRPRLGRGTAGGDAGPNVSFETSRADPGSSRPKLDCRRCFPTPKPPACARRRPSRAARRASNPPPHRPAQPRISRTRSRGGTAVCSAAPIRAPASSRPRARLPLVRTAQRPSKKKKSAREQRAEIDERTKLISWPLYVATLRVYFYS